MRFQDSSALFWEYLVSMKNAIKCQCREAAGLICKEEMHVSGLLARVRPEHLGFKPVLFSFGGENTA